MQSLQCNIGIHQNKYHQFCNESEINLQFASGSPDQDLDIELRYFKPQTIVICMHPKQSHQYVFEVANSLIQSTTQNSQEINHEKRPSILFATNRISRIFNRYQDENKGIDLLPSNITCSGGALEKVKFNIIQIEGKAEHSSIHAEELSSILQQLINERNSQSILLNKDFRLSIKVNEQTITIEAQELRIKYEKAEVSSEVKYGFINEKTQILYTLDIQLKGRYTLTNPDTPPSLISYQPNSFEEIGIGGLDQVLIKIFTAFIMPRMLPAKTQNALGLSFSKGMILYGPPGTGKTLIARKICEILRGIFKVIKGSELLSGLVGEGAKNVRKLFEPPEQDWINYGKSSPLHVIVIDEIDALCPKRGAHDNVDGGATNQIVAQFLANLDGVSQHENVFIIGTTNRPQDIDEALLRSGRLDQQYEINLPDLAGRVAIWKIHTLSLKESGFISDEVINEMANNSNGLTGAQIKGCINQAVIKKLMGSVNTAQDLWKSIDQVAQKVSEGSLQFSAEDFDLPNRA